MNELKKIFKLSSVYLIGNVLTRIIGIIMLPIYTAYIKPMDYGKYDVSITYITFLGSVVFLDIWNGMLRFMYDYADKKGKNSVIVTSFTIFILSSFLYTLIFYMAHFYIHVDHLVLIYIYGLISNLTTIVSFIARGYGENKLFMLGGLAGSIVIAASNYLLLVILKYDYSSLYIASIIGCVVNITVVMFSLQFNTVSINKKLFNHGLFKDLLSFSLPLCVNSIAYWFLTAYSRVFISSHLNYFENGLYAVAMKFSVMITLVSECVKLGWQETSYKRASKKNSSDEMYYSNMINIFARCFYVGAMIAIPAIKMIYPYFINSQYDEAKVLIPMCILATCFSSMSGFLGNLFGAVKHTKNLFITLVVSSIVNISMLYVFVPKHGVYWVNVALFCGFLTNCIMRIIMLKKYIVMKFNYVEACCFLGMFWLLYM